MINEIVLQALTFQMNHEISNSYAYRFLAGLADYQSLIGTTSWFMKQSDEERTHFDKFCNYIQDQGHVPHLLSVPEQIPEGLDLLQMFERTVILEMNTLANLKQLALVCKECGDDQTYELVLWFLKEQVEECKMVTDILNRIKLAGNGLGYIIIDNELGER
jgi:ferritin